MKKKFLQKIANAIYNMAKRSTTRTDFDLWFNTGMKLDRWCVSREIYLD